MSQTRYLKNALTLLLFVTLCAGLTWTLGGRGKTQHPAGITHLALLVPDHESLEAPVTQAWLDAAQEEGLLITPMTDDQFIKAMTDGVPIEGLVVPDTVHTTATDLLVSNLYQYVQAGGKLLLSFDAGVLLHGSKTYAIDASRLSDLVGVRYALYSELGDQTTRRGPAYLSKEAQQRLAIQPGKLDFDNSPLSQWGELTTYGYPHLNYHYYKTETTGTAHRLAQSDSGDAIMSIHRYGKGSVLFVNLPLGYLKTRTDSYLLQRSLSYFGSQLLGQPRLATVPDGIGGVILNMHVDSNAAQSQLLQMELNRWFDDGPYSIHVTAGPDTYKTGDAMGLNVPHNPTMQGLLKRLHDQGHEVGSHGGWGHDIFGKNVSEEKQDFFLDFLEKNHTAISDAIGTEVTSYSAPMGNHPQWVTEWLQDKHFKGYYTTADTGLGPTRSYVNGQRRASTALWAFPISHYKQIATLDELGLHNIKESDINRFLLEFLNHVSEQRIARLFYFHPATTHQFKHSLDLMRFHAMSLKSRQVFRWYTMAQLSDFLNRREQARWDIQRHKGNGTLTLTAHHPASLESLSWIFDRKKVQDLQVTEGTAQVLEDESKLIVTASAGQVLKLEWREMN